MNITFAPRGVLQIDDARIVHRNFEGKASQYNHEGDRNFSLVIPTQELSEELVNLGWNVKIRPAQDEDGDPFMYLPVKLKFTSRGPHLYLVSVASTQKLTEDTASIIDKIDILSVDMDIRPYDWEYNGKTGRTAYLESIRVTQRVDRFAEIFSVGFNAN